MKRIWTAKLHTFAGLSRRKGKYVVHTTIMITEPTTHGGRIVDIEMSAGEAQQLASTLLAYAARVNEYNSEDRS